MNAPSLAVDTDAAQEEVHCKRCYGTGEDRDGADCVPCEGFGTVLVSVSGTSGNPHRKFNGLHTGVSPEET
jgi:RecJ-like exonuclease